MSKRSQKGGISITKRGAVLEAIKKGKTDAASLQKFREKVNALENKNFDNSKAMWVAIERSRPVHLKELSNMKAATVNSERSYEPPTGPKRKETVLRESFQFFFQ